MYRTGKPVIQIFRISMDFFLNTLTQHAAIFKCVKNVSRFISHESSLDHSLTLTDDVSCTMALCSPTSLFRLNMDSVNLLLKLS